MEHNQKTEEYWVYQATWAAADRLHRCRLVRQEAGVYNWNGDIYAVWGTDLYKNGVDIGNVDGTGGVYQFSASLGSTPRLQLGNGVKSYNWDRR